MFLYVSDFMNSRFTVGIFACLSKSRRHMIRPVKAQPSNAGLYVKPKPSS